MENTDPCSHSYLIVEKMVRRGELNLSELEHLLDKLRKQEQITSEEEQALLELAWQLRVGPSLPQQGLGSSSA